MPSVNEQLMSGQIDHSVNLSHYSNGVVRRILALLNRTDPDLVARIQSALDRLPPESFTVRRLEQLLGSVRELNAEAYASVGEALRAELKDLAEHESGFQFNLFRSALPEVVKLAEIDVGQTAAAALARPFQGRLLKEALDGLEAGRAASIRDQIRIGYVSNETTAQIIQRIRGTRARGYADGLLEAPRRHIETIVRTAVSHTAGVARDNFLAANSDIVAAEVWLSTLDSRTSSLCRVRDHLKYTAEDHKPIGHRIPWLAGPGRLHWNCRSTSTPVTKSWAQAGLDANELTGSQRASMDGAVPASTNYAAWFARQSASRQDEIVGPARGMLYRKGEVTFDGFYDSRGTFLTLDELRARDAVSMKKAA